MTSCSRIFNFYTVFYRVLVIVVFRKIFPCRSVAFCCKYRRDYRIAFGIFCNKRTVCINSRSNRRIFRSYTVLIISVIPCMCCGNCHTRIVVQLDFYNIVYIIKDKLVIFITKIFKFFEISICYSVVFT